MAKKQVRLCLTIDVEEEGLFSDVYARENVTAANVPALKEMEPLARRGYPARPVRYGDRRASAPLEHAAGGAFLRRQGRGASAGEAHGA